MPANRMATRTNNEPAFTHDLFLNHSSKDKAVVRAVAERSQKDGPDVWFDKRVIKPGGSIPAKTEKAGRS